MEQLGKYSIKRKLGEGVFGAVFLAEDNIGREVALKVLHPQVASDEMMSGYFRREAVALGRLSHPNIVLIHTFDRWGPNLPGEIDLEEFAKLAERSSELPLIAAHAALGCRGVSRADLRYDDTAGEPDVLTADIPK